MATCSGQAVCIVWTDWYCEGMTDADHKSMSEAARKLARNPHVVAVLVVGSDPVNSKVMYRDLAPLAAKLRVFPVGGIDPDLIAQLLSKRGTK